MEHIDSRYYRLSDQPEDPVIAEISLSVTRPDTDNPNTDLKDFRTFGYPALNVICRCQRFITFPVTT